MRKVLYCSCAYLVFVATVLEAHAGDSKPAGAPKRIQPTAPAATSPKPPENLKDSDNPAAGARGTLVIDVSAEVTKAPLPAKVELHGAQGAPVVIEVPQGKLSTPQPAGTYQALTFIYEEGLPILVNTQKVVIGSTKAAALVVQQLEGTTGGRLLRDFDRDFDLATDRAELAADTNPDDPASIPGRPKIAIKSPVLGKKAQWYRGELHAQSKHGMGTESVRELVQRAEALGLDFLAIADPNTLAAARDPEFRSSSVVLIPAMLWGSDERGYALIYGPQTFPEPASNHLQAQAVSRLVQAQGGVFAAAHPCLPGRTWQWEVPYVNAVEVWCREWEKLPPAALDGLKEDMKRRTRERELITSIAAAVDSKTLSGNGQAALFWDYELARNHKSTPIAGSMTGSPAVPMGQPLTYVYAEEKSVRGILDGIRMGRSYVTSGPDGPLLNFSADALRDGKIDVVVGGAVPVGTACNLIIGVERAKGKKLEVLRNGLPISSKIIEDDPFTMLIPQNLDTPCAFRVRVIEAGTNAGFGAVKVLAMSGAIYADGIIMLPKGMRPEDLRIAVQDKKTLQSGLVSPVYATGVEGAEGPDGNPLVHIEKRKGPAVPPPISTEGLPPFNDPSKGELRPPVIQEQR